MKELNQLIDKKVLTNKIMSNFNKALKEEEFKEFIDQLGLSYEYLAKYTSILEESKQEYCHCKNCKSLLACQNKISGYAYLPSIKNKKITFNYQMCHYKKEIQKQNQYLNLVYTFDVPEEIRQANMKDIDKSNKDRYEILKYIINFINEYQKDKKQKGLYLHGNFGCGKTYLISAMLNDLAQKGINSAIVFWPEYLRNLKTSFSNNEEFKEKFNKIKEAPILLIDDIGAESVTPWSRDEILCPILQYRMEEYLPTFFTSNFDLEQLEHHLSITKDSISEVKARRIIERIKQLTEAKLMTGANMRK